MAEHHTIAGLILAGGRGARMGADKPFVELKGETLIARAIARARPQADFLAISASGEPARFAPFGLPMIADAMPDYAGPLAGILSGFEWAERQRAGASWLASFACDAPFFPLNLVARLSAAARGADIALAEANGQHHPVFAVWRIDLKDDLDAALHAGVRKIDDFIARHRSTRVRFDDEQRDPFFNINTPDDLAEAARILESE